MNNKSLVLFSVSVYRITFLSQCHLVTVFLHILEKMSYIYTFPILFSINWTGNYATCPSYSRPVFFFTT